FGRNLEEASEWMVCSRSRTCPRARSLAQSSQSAPGFLLAVASNSRRFCTLLRWTVCRTVLSIRTGWPRTESLGDERERSREAGGGPSFIRDQVAFCSAPPLASSREPMCRSCASVFRPPAATNFGLLYGPVHPAHSL